MPSKFDTIPIQNEFLDRLLRFGSELIFTLCEIFSVEVCIINKSEESAFEEDLSNDV